MELVYGDHWVVEIQRQHVRPPMNTMIIVRMSSSWCQICYSALWVPSIASSEWMLRHGSVVGSQYILFQILRFTTYLLYNRRCMKSLQYITRMRIPWLSNDSCVGDPPQLMLEIAAVESLKTGIHYQSLLVELGLSTRKSIDVYEDNLSCRVSAKSLKCFKKARHYQSKLRFL